MADHARILQEVVGSDLSQVLDEELPKLFGRAFMRELQGGSGPVPHHRLQVQRVTISLHAQHFVVAVVLGAVVARVADAPIPSEAVGNADVATCQLASITVKRGAGCGVDRVAQDLRGNDQPQPEAPWTRSARGPSFQRGQRVDEPTWASLGACGGQAETGKPTRLKTDACGARASWAWKKILQRSILCSSGLSVERPAQGTAFGGVSGLVLASRQGLFLANFAGRGGTTPGKRS